MISTTTQLSAEKKVDKELQKMIEKDKVNSNSKRKSEIAKNESKMKMVTV